MPFFTYYMLVSGIKVLYDLGVVPNKEPFQNLFNQGMILGEGNEKCLNLKGMFVNPDDVVREYGDGYITCL